MCKLNLCKLNLNILQELNIVTLTLAITSVADKRCENLLDNARTTAEKFKKAFTLFARCHQVYSGQKYLTEDDLTDLGNAK